METATRMPAVGLLTEKEAAAFLGMKRGSLANQRSRGVGIPYVQLGSGPRPRVRYSVADIQKYVDQGRRFPSVRENMENGNGDHSKK